MTNNTENPTKAESKSETVENAGSTPKAASENRAENSKPTATGEITLEKSDQTLIGPGRTRTSKLPLVHGLYASDIVLWWESHEDFEQLFRELKSEWLPQGRQEMETMLSLARLNWLKHRLMRSTQIAFRRDPFLAELERAGAKTWADISAHMDEQAKGDDNLMTLVRENLQELKAATKAASALMTASDPDTQKIFSGVETVKDLFFKRENVYQQMFERVYQKKPGMDMNEPGVSFSDAYSLNPTTLAEQAYHPDYLEKLVRLEASIDARIDKLLQRLTSIKEYKRIAREARLPKVVSSPPIAPPATKA